MCAFADHIFGIARKEIIGHTMHPHVAPSPRDPNAFECTFPGFAPGPAAAPTAGFRSNVRLRERW